MRVDSLHIIQGEQQRSLFIRLSTFVELQLTYSITL